MNYSLRLAVEKAKAANMPRDNIERAVKRGTGELGGAKLENVTYEIYGPGASAILVEALSDNKNRTSADVKAVLNRHGGKLASSGAVSYLFCKRGIVSASVDRQSKEEAEMLVIDSGADDYKETEEGFLIFTKPENLFQVSEKLSGAGLQIDTKEIALEPKVTIELDDEQSEKVIKLLQALDEIDDVTEVNCNLG